VIFEAEGEATGRCSPSARSRSPRRRNGRATSSAGARCSTASPGARGERVRDPLSALPLGAAVRPGAGARPARCAGRSRKPACRNEVMLNRPRGPEVRPLPQDAALRSGAGDR
jgi:hypothetical protein